MFLFNLDSPAISSILPQASPVTVAGWFFDAAGRPARQLRVSDGRQTVVCDITHRPDVVECHKTRWALATGIGFTASIDAAPGPLDLRVIAETEAGDVVELGRVSLTVSAPVAVEAATPFDDDTFPPAPLPNIPVPRLPPNAHAVISVLFYYREDLIFRSLDTLIPQLLYATQATAARVTLVCVLNYPAHADLTGRIATHMAKLGPLTDRVRIIIDEPGHNLGFGGGHNHVFGQHDSDLFVMVNSDVRMEQIDWLARIITLFAGEPHAYAGLAATAARLRSDGCGIEVPNPRHDGFDFVDGSLLAINTVTGRRLGLFIHSYRYFYFEDADLCLRYRQAGLAPALLELAYHHDRFSSTRLLPRNLVEGILDHNRARFFEAWGPFLARRTLSRRLLVRFEPLDCIQQCAALPALFGLLADHPSAVIDLTGVHATLRALFQHPQLAIRSSAPADASCTYYRQYHLSRPGPTALPLTTTICASLQTDGDFEAARLHLASLTDAGQDAASPATSLMVVSRDTPYFHGLRPDVDVLNEIISARRPAGRVAIYTDLPLFQWPAGWDAARSLDGGSLLALLRELQGRPLVITTDHWILQLAQLVGAPCFAWLGATAPRTRIWDWSSCGAFTAPDVACIGCSHALGTVHENTCVRADVACMDHKWLPLFLSQLQAFSAQSGAPPWLVHAWAIPDLSTRRQTSPEMDLSRWSRTMAGRVLVLIPMKPGLSEATLQHCKSLADRAILDLPHSRVVFDDRTGAPPRGTHPYRQAALAEIRQGMIDRHLRDEQWVFWVDADIVDYSKNLIIDLIHRAEGGIAAPFVIMEGSPDEPPTNSHGFGPGRFFDVAGFVEANRWASFTPPYFTQPGPAIDVESVGSCYLVNADLYRHGARHEADPLSRQFVAAGQTWPENAVKLGQDGQPLAFTEHYSVCAFARAHGLPVRAHADLVAYHERVG